MRLLACILAAVAAAASWHPADSRAQSYPAKPVRYVVPFPPGGSPDIVGRLLAERLSRLWGQQMVVDNQSGAGGTVGAAVAARAAPDGYTLFQCNIASSAIASSIYAKLPYDALRDFASITRIGTTPNGLVVHPSMPAASLPQFIAYAKANPGKLSYGSTAAGSSPQLTMELFKIMTKTDIVHIPYKGAAPALVDLLGGQIPVAIANVPALLAPVQAGRMRALAVTGAKRSSQFPDVPTMIESGLKDFDVTSWYAVCAPAATAAPILDKLNADFTKVLLSADLRERMTELMIDVAPTSRDGLTAFIKAETARWAKVVKEAKIPQQ
jgi:tripartite-type tricarboxylate transporter receptor subunit TctC